MFLLDHHPLFQVVSRTSCWRRNYGMVLVCSCQGASLVNTIWLDHGVFAARQLVAGLQSGPAACSTSRDKERPGQVERGRCTLWIVASTGRWRRAVVPVPARRREMRCNKRGGSLRRSPVVLRPPCGRGATARRTMLRVSVRDRDAPLTTGPLECRCGAHAEI
jgi:hypothetical protein